MDRKPKSAKRGDLLTQKRARWLAEVDDSDYVIAYDFLSVLTDDDIATAVVERFRDQHTIVKRKARHILRAAELPSLSRSDEYVMRELVKIATGVKFSPVLFARATTARKAILVDGYERLCAAELCDPDCDIPVKII